MRVNFEEAIRKNYVVTIEGDNVEKLNCNNKTNKFRINNIKAKIPMYFSKINTTIHRELDNLEYIEFWEGIKIYKVVDC